MNLIDEMEEVADTEPAILIRPIHIITSDTREIWPKASFEIDEEVFVKVSKGSYHDGQIVLILPSEHGETVYVIRHNRTLIIRTKAELAA